MGVYSRDDSPYWWIYLETTKEKEKTAFKIGTTTTQRRDSKKLAEDLYHQRMNALAGRLYKLPSAQPAIRFGAYADTYAVDTVAHHKGKLRELDILKALRHFFADTLITAIDPDLVRQYQTARSATCAPRTINREVDLLKAMLRDAVPKYLAVSPLTNMKRMLVTKPRRRLMTPTEEKKLHAVADDVERALLILAVDGLIRLGDLLDLKRTDRNRGWLSVADPKNGVPYDVALTPRAAAALDKLRGTGTYYFARFREAENPRDWPGSVRQRLERLCRDANIPYGRKRNGITFHWATRRTGAHRWVVKQKKSIPAVQRQGGWKKPDVLLSIYAEADREDQRQAFAPRAGRRSA